MDFFMSVILPIVGFLLAIVGAWDKISIGVKYFESKRSERLVKRAKEEITKIEYYENNFSHFVAYEFRQLFLLLLVIFLVSVLEIAPPEKISGNELRSYFSYFFCISAGYFAGNAVRVANCVLYAKKLKEKAMSKISELSGTNNSNQQGPSAGTR